MQNNPSRSSPSYKLLNWNLLCSAYCDDSCSPKLDPKYKAWDYRKKLFHEILSSEKDIDLFCFEEVDQHEDFSQLINRGSEKIKFESVYYERFNRPLGIALFYNIEKFQYMQSHQIFLTSFQNGAKGSNFLLVAFLQELLAKNENEKSQSICVIITHLTAWDRFEEMRICQVNSLLEYLDSQDFQSELTSFNCRALILCGDFNAQPGYPSINNLMNYTWTLPESIPLKLTKLKSSFNFSDQSQDDYDTEQCTVLVDDINSNQSGLLKRFYFDYIFTSDEIVVLNKKMSVQFKNDTVGLPSETFPSDHLYLVIEFC